MGESRFGDHGLRARILQQPVLLGTAVLTAVALVALGVYAAAGSAPSCPKHGAIGNQGRELAVINLLSITGFDLLSITECELEMFNPKGKEKIKGEKIKGEKNQGKK